MDAKQFSGTNYRDFEDLWYAQSSSARMSPDGKRTQCSDAVDATGHYIWRENGLKNGRCCGIDFQQAAQKRRAQTCSDVDPACTSAEISLYVPYTYDAVIALAHGLDKLVTQGFGPDNITAGRLTKAIRESPFEGVTGNVSFMDNGDRREEDIEFVVYNYHATTRNLRAVGDMKAGGFVPCNGGHCPELLFSGGSSRIPRVARGVRNNVIT